MSNKNHKVYKGGKVQINMENKSFTQIKISIETWQELKARKQRPSHTFDEIIKELLEEAK